MTPFSCFRRGLFLALAAWVLSVAAAPAQVVSPPPPKEYDVQIRFRIRQPMPQYLDRLDELVGWLKGIGFVRDARPEDEPEDPDVDRLTGTMPSQTARKAIINPFVQTVLLVPHGYKLPEPGQRVKVTLDTAANLPRDRQRVLFEQILNQLDQIGFREMVGYDHRGYTRVLGTIAVENLDRLLRDLRTEPSGWLVPRTPIGALPTPIRNVLPIRVVEVLPEPADVPPMQEAPGGEQFLPEQAHLVKLSSDLRAALAAEKDDQKKLRVEVILRTPPPELDSLWDRALRSTAPGATVEGQFGTVITVVAPVPRVPDLARSPAVLAVRLPRSGESPLRPLTEAPADFLKNMRLNVLHRLGYRGQDVKIVVVAGDFGGWKKVVGNQLPAKTKLVDYTTQRNPDLLPDPMPSDDVGFGPGTVCALAVHAAAPDAELVLVRIDPAAPHQLLAVARLLNDDPPLVPDNLADRANEISRDTEFLLARRRELLDERKLAIEGLSFEEGESKLPELRKRYEESQARLKRVLKDIDDLNKLEGQLRERAQRMFAVRADLQALRNARIVVCPLVWNAGHAMDGANPLSRYFDERPFVGTPGDSKYAKIASLRANRGTLWVQAAGDTRGQTWAGLFRDRDNNLAMEFAPPSESIHKGRWTNELNFLAWNPYGAAPAPELPERTRVRISFQWMEPHDPALSAEADDLYAEPLTAINLLVLHQRDPSGTKLATDDLEVVARNVTPAVRLFKSPTLGVYEQSVEFDIAAAGRFALRVEGRVPDSTRPAILPTVAGERRQFELRPRIVIEQTDAASRAKGRVVFLDYAGATNWPSPPSAGVAYGCVGIPGDARTVLTVGGADASGRPSPFGSVGAGPQRELLLKPDVLGFESVDFGDKRQGAGTGIAAALDAGAAACLFGLNASANPRHFTQALQLPPGSVLRIPDAWLPATKR
ncbi:MAG: hypothetical protein ACJ8F7_16595 [Gemmataceae bacterium]